MAAGATASPLPRPASLPPTMLSADSPSNLSSPLSEVEDHDQDPDDIHNNRILGQATSPERPEDDAGEDNDESRSVSDGDSNLSELDVDDSEAETERLYDTPTKSDHASVGMGATRQYGDQQNKTFERSLNKPKKSLASLKASSDDARDESDQRSVSDDDDEGDGASGSFSDIEGGSFEDGSGLPELSGQKTFKELPTGATLADGQTRPQLAEPRKRKRSPELSDVDERIRKRTASMDPQQRKAFGSHHSPDDLAGLPTTQISEQSDEESPGAVENKDGAARLSTTGLDREDGSFKKTKISAEQPGSKSPTEVPLDDGRLGEAVQIDAEKSPAGQDGAGSVDEEIVDAEAEVEGDADADEEAEVAHKNEEEVERRKAAWEQLSEIEKHFGTFRDRLYQERLDQLDHEEAMLTADNPTHPDYVAMMQCIDGRRDEKLRIIDLEYKLKMDVLQRRAAAERAQIMSQFYQSIRESREKALENLGRQWYEIQHERRRHSNRIPDYNLRYPSTRTQNTINAVSYNREVSILAGIAKHRGFPAAPDIKGADAADVEDDFEQINRARQASNQAIPLQYPSYHEYGGLAIGRSLGPAAEEFLEQTPWANPNHPSHHIPRQNSMQESDSIGHSGRPGERRHSHQAGVYATTLSNVELAAQKSRSSNGQSVNRASTMVQETPTREPLAQVS